MISREEVEHIALLAELKLSEEEIEIYRNQLSRIIEHASKIRELDLQGVEPTSHASGIFNVFRDDVVGPTISREEALRNAPSTEAGCFKVPPIT